MIVRARKTELVPKANTTGSFCGLCLKKDSIGNAFVQLVAFGTGRGRFGDVAGGHRCAQVCNFRQILCGNDWGPMGTLRHDEDDATGDQSG